MRFGPPLRFLFAPTLFTLSLVASTSSAQPHGKGPPPPQLKVAKGEGHHVVVTAPPGTFCGVDGAKLTEVKDPLVISTTRQHTLRCGANATGRGAIDQLLPADALGKLVVRGSVAPEKDQPKGRLTLAITDAQGVTIEDVQVTAKGPDGATIGAVTEAGKGNYTADASWAKDKKSFKVHVEIAGGDPIDDIDVKTDGSVPPPPTPPTPPPNVSGNNPPTNDQQPTAPGQPPPPPKPVKPRPVNFEFGIVGGVGVGSPGVGPDIGLEAGISKLWKNVGLALLFRGTYEKYSSQDNDEQIIGLALPLTLRILPKNDVFPYLTFVPQLSFDGTVYQGLPGRDVALTGTLGGIGGVGFKVGPIFLFLEAGGRYGKANHHPVIANIPPFTGLGGARFSL